MGEGGLNLSKALCAIRNPLGFPRFRREEIDPSMIVRRQPIAEGDPPAVRRPADRWVELPGYSGGA